MNDLSLQKQKEKWFVDIFLELSGYGGITLISRERPDWELHIGCRAIGLEVREFFVPESDTGAPVGTQMVRKKAIAQAEKKFLSSGGPTVDVTFVFNNDPRLGPSDTKEVLEFVPRFLDVVMCEGYANGSYGRWRDKTHWVFDKHDLRYWEYFYRFLDKTEDPVPELDMCFVNSSPVGNTGCWSFGGPTALQHAESRYVQAELNAKRQNFEDYNLEYPEVWLLIYNAGAMDTIPNKIGDLGMSSHYDFPYHKAFWLDTFPDRALIELHKQRYEDCEIGA